MKNGDNYITVKKKLRDQYKQTDSEPLAGL